MWDDHTPLSHVKNFCTQFFTIHVHHIMLYPTPLTFLRSSQTPTISSGKHLIEITYYSLTLSISQLRKHFFKQSLRYHQPFMFPQIIQTLLPFLSIKCFKNFLSRASRPELNIRMEIFNRTNKKRQRKNRWNSIINNNDSKEISLHKWIQFNIVVNNNHELKKKKLKPII